MAHGWDPGRGHRCHQFRRGVSGRVHRSARAARMDCPAGAAAGGSRIRARLLLCVAVPLSARTRGVVLAVTCSLYPLAFLPVAAMLRLLLVGLGRRRLVALIRATAARCAPVCLGCGATPAQHHRTVWAV